MESCSFGSEIEFSPLFVALWAAPVWGTPSPSTGPHKAERPSLSAPRPAPDPRPRRYPPTPIEEVRRPNPSARGLAAGLGDRGVWRIIPRGGAPHRSSARGPISATDNRTRQRGTSARRERGNRKRYRVPIASTTTQPVATATPTPPRLPLLLLQLGPGLFRFSFYVCGDGPVGLLPSVSHSADGEKSKKRRPGLSTQPKDRRSHPRALLLTHALSSAPAPSDGRRQIPEPLGAWTGRRTGRPGRLAS
ncbi:uncharacterized protein LOC131190369 [Ahaetulla prasina]|uniref:uncharacterized protein LOC131190369 n=1 Tax=Ahaetulla prasina TaxID=499056 RepID=UPI0026494E58|nr:uncharacterized protein LOC131190369 [Ahaetulla prasina]